MSVHPIPDPPPITDAMTQYADGCDARDLLGTVTTAYEIPDSDRRETLLRFDDGRVVQIGAAVAAAVSGRPAASLWLIAFGLACCLPVIVFAPDGTIVWQL